MAALLKVKIITPKEIAFDGTAQAVTVPAETGEMQVYPGHIPVLARVAKGRIQLEISGKAPVCFDAEEGFFRVTAGEVSLLLDAVTPTDAPVA